MFKMTSFLLKNAKIMLDDSEKELFALLKDSMKYHQRNTIMRVAGGWVRDKLLQKTSQDIDIALDDLYGLEFAKYVNDYLTHLGKEVKTVAVIHANPEQSKHLETANLRVLGFEIDCVNLRAEEYTETRIPVIRVGTPHEDSLRRDFTINALFYNINEDTIEDFSGNGLIDLEQKIIRTPISPFITFKDDPLRILRAIRFGSRLNFQLESDLCYASQDPEIQLHLAHKVSRERIYKECEGMMNHIDSRPCYAFSLIHKLNLLKIILPFEERIQYYNEKGGEMIQYPKQWDLQSIETLYWVNLLFQIRKEYNVWVIDPLTQYTSDYQMQSISGLDIKLLTWASVCLPFTDIFITEKKKSILLIHQTLHEIVKMENNSVKYIVTLLNAAKLFQGVQKLNFDSLFPIVKESKELWKDALLLACASELANYSLQHGSIVPSTPGFLPITITEPIHAIIIKYLTIEQSIFDLSLHEIWTIKPLFKGTELATTFQLKPGPIIGSLNEELFRWQAMTGSNDVDACLDHLQKYLQTLKK